MGYMDPQDKIRRFKWGLCLCWIAILAVPADMPLINFGPCLGGPETLAGSITVLILGLCSTVGALLGIGGVIRGITTVRGFSRIGGGLSICGACLALLPGCIFLLTGFFSSQYLLSR